MQSGRGAWLDCQGRDLIVESGDAAGKLNLRSRAVLFGVDDQKRAEEALRQSQEDLARINRATTLGELAASVAHELSQPLSGALTNANTCLRKLRSKEPDVDEMRKVVTRLARDVQRAADIIERVCSQELIDVNEIHRETITLLRDETVRHNISVRAELEDELPPILGDRVQVQQDFASADPSLSLTTEVLRARLR